MARALGIGGVFFKAQDPEKLANWYQKWLSVPVEEAEHSARFLPADMPASGYSVWAPFPADTDYFQPSSNAFMFNLVVNNLDDAFALIMVPVFTYSLIFTDSTDG